jgi:solute carrier family 12 (potassium/chloride transporter), member 4/6
MTEAMAIEQACEREEKVEKKTSFGTFLGVFVPTILMVFGVIIFLRLGWIVGQGGLSTSLIIITLGALIALLTTLSLSAIATNTEVGKGGVYYILSRALGIEVGCAVGLPLYFKQTLSIAFCCVGFAESLHDLVPAWSITNIGMASLLILTALAYFSLKGALKVQVFIFLTIIASLISLFAGGYVPPIDPDTYVPSSPMTLGFWALFAIFFPAMTGVESSVSLSGDLKNPSKSLPLGTISALLVAYAIYMAIPIFLVHYVPMDRLADDPLIIQEVARIPALIIVGIWGATISSALGGLLGAPRTLQALADDGVVPKLFGKTSGKSEDPKIATLITFVIALMGVYFGSINIIAPMLTMICLICYGVLNLAAGLEAIMANPSWRPRFNIHWTIPIFGAVLCLVTMLMIGAGTAIISLSFVFTIYLVAKKRHLTSSWEDLRLGMLMYFSRSAIYKLSYADNISKSWRPHFLVFTGKPEETSNNLVSFSQAISQSKGFLTMASFLLNQKYNEEQKRTLCREVTEKLQKDNIEALVQISYAEKVTQGMHRMIEHYGIGPLVPNTIVFGGISKEDETIDFAHVVQTAYQRDCNVVIINDKFNSQNSPQINGQSSDIHIWWDDASETNDHLMIILSILLQRNPSWRKSKICLKGVVTTEMLKEEKTKEFKLLAHKKRLSMDIDILVSQPGEFLELVKTFSKDAGMVFLSLRAPGAEESMESYANYLQSMPHSSLDFPPNALILSAQNMPLDHILN